MSPGESAEPGESGEPGDGGQNDETAPALPEDTVIVPPAAAGAVPDDDDTVSVSDAASSDDTDPTVLVEREGPDEATVIVVERGARLAPPEEPSPDDDADDTDGADDTVIVDDEATVHVPRHEVVEIAPAASGSDADADSGSTAAPAAVVSAVAKPAMAPPSGRRRGELRPAPVPSGFGGLPVVAPGAGAVTAYRPRRLPAPPRRGESVAASEPPRRIIGAVSVAKRSRTASIVAIASFVGSFVVLAGLMMWAVKELVGF